VALDQQPAARRETAVTEYVGADHADSIRDAARRVLLARCCDHAWGEDCECAREVAADVAALAEAGLLPPVPVPAPVLREMARGVGEQRRRAREWDRAYWSAVADYEQQIADLCAAVDEARECTDMVVPGWSTR
jgi:hypothetical protein